MCVSVFPPLSLFLSLSLSVFQDFCSVFIYTCVFLHSSLYFSMRVILCRYLCDFVSVIVSVFLCVVVSLCNYMRAYVCVCVFVSSSTYVRLCIYLCMSVIVRVSVSQCVYFSLCACMYMYVKVHVLVSPCASMRVAVNLFIFVSTWCRCIWFSLCVSVCLYAWVSEKLKYSNKNLNHANLLVMTFASSRIGYRSPHSFSRLDPKLHSVVIFSSRGLWNV